MIGKKIGHSNLIHIPDLATYEKAISPSKVDHSSLLGWAFRWSGWVARLWRSGCSSCNGSGGWGGRCGAVSLFCLFLYGCLKAD